MVNAVLEGVPRDANREAVVEFSVPAVPVTQLPFALTETSVLAIIPARYQSARLPGKALVDIAGRPMIEHVYRRAAAAKSLDFVLVATDDERIARAVDAFGGVACMTASTHGSGTDRLAEVAAAVPCRLIVNVQGDEPMLDPAVIDAAVEPLRRDPSIEIGTAARPLRDHAELANPNVVKVVRDGQGFGLYFSRAPIPYGRDDVAAPIARVHIGLYVYRRDTLLRLSRLPPGPLERTETLEQLRALENGVRINVVDTTYHSVEVNTQEDLERVRHLMLTGARG
ncbi:MAG: 3-deoxy-manno-octulosonate cytidylyltransferase [Acidobacteria bacterium]|nr:3-deoxy-manno-octulosonate cytidylyltransferase [Acidobacteriota bacterium]